MPSTQHLKSTDVSQLILLILQKPHRVDNGVPVGEVAGTLIQQAVLGTCTNGMLEDLTIAARILKAPQACTLMCV